jgi:hypothetical protein
VTSYFPQFSLHSLIPLSRPSPAHFRFHFNAYFILHFRIHFSLLCVLHNFMCSFNPVLFHSYKNFLRCSSHYTQHLSHSVSHNILERVLIIRPDVIPCYISDLKAIYRMHDFPHEELHDLYSSPSIIRIIKSRRMRWAGHVARMGEKRNG